MKDFFSKCDQIRRKLQIWSHLLNKSLMETFIFCVATFSRHGINWMQINDKERTFSLGTRVHSSSQQQNIRCPVRNLLKRL